MTFLSITTALMNVQSLAWVRAITVTECFSLVFSLVHIWYPVGHVHDWYALQAIAARGARSCRMARRFPFQGGSTRNH
jgi:hypothetical protein